MKSPSPTLLPSTCHHDLAGCISAGLHGGGYAHVCQDVILGEAQIRRGAVSGKFDADGAFAITVYGCCQGANVRVLKVERLEMFSLWWGFVLLNNGLFV